MFQDILSPYVFQFACACSCEIRNQRFPETQGHITIENLTLEADKDDKVRGDGIRRSVCGGQCFILQAFNRMKASLIRIASSECYCVLEYHLMIS